MHSFIIHACVDVGMVQQTEADHVPAPAEHAPRKETYLLESQIMVAEVDHEDAWVQGPGVAVKR